MSLHCKPSHKTLTKRRERARKALAADPARFYARRHKRKHTARARPKWKAGPLTEQDMSDMRVTLEDLVW
jgi:hypothetical protein